MGGEMQKANCTNERVPEGRARGWAKPWVGRGQTGGGA